MRLYGRPPDKVQPVFREQEGRARGVVRNFHVDPLHVKETIEILCIRCLDHLVVSSRLRYYIVPASNCESIIT